MEKFLFAFKKFIPKPAFDAFAPIYHWLLAFIAVILYGFPSRGMKVVGITGTSGKTTTIEMLFKIFSEAGFKVAALDGLYFRILDKTEPNLLKMTTPGRSRVQKFLRETKRAGAEYVFIEMTSEGIKQYRHKFIKFYAAIFTNLSEEHLEAHGGFENYRAAKGELFKQAPLAILNGDDSNFEFFYRLAPKEKIVYIGKDFPNGWQLKIPGEFNKMNAVAAMTFAKREGVPLEVSKKALEKIETLPGRMEFIETEKDFKVLVDYAFLPQTLKLAYEEAKKGSSGLVCVLGATGGGRDKWKRPKVGDVAAENCRKVFITNEDPYDEDPMQIMNEVAGAHNFEKILDRREAIRAALKATRPGETVVITGKGAEPWIMGPNGTKTAWDDRRVVREELEKL
ncbi:MAG: Mur ligase family protein [bacterium]|nr:Mur ligase family protein [bacterium]